MSISGYILDINYVLVKIYLQERIHTLMSAETGHPVSGLEVRLEDRVSP